MKLFHASAINDNIIPLFCQRDLSHQTGTLNAFHEVFLKQ